MKIEFSRQIFEKYSNTKISWKSPPVVAELLHAGGRTDMTKLIVVFPNFANSSKKSIYIYIYIYIFQNIFIVPIDAHYYKIIKMLKQF